MMTKRSSEASIDNLANIQIDHNRRQNSPDPTLKIQPGSRKITSDHFSPVLFHFLATLLFLTVAWDPAPCAAASGRHYSKFYAMVGTYRHCTQGFVVKKKQKTKQNKTKTETTTKNLAARLKLSILGA